jgi:hypothetical protein
VDAEGNALAVGLFADNTLNVDGVLETVDAGDLALTTLVGAPDDGDFVVLADGDGSDLEMMLAFVPSISKPRNFLFIQSSRHRVFYVVKNVPCNLMGWFRGEERIAQGRFRTLCFSRSSLLRGALMMTRRSLEGALK